MLGSAVGLHAHAGKRPELGRIPVRQFTPAPANPLLGRMLTVRSWGMKRQLLLLRDRLARMTVNAPTRFRYGPA